MISDDSLLTIVARSLSHSTGTVTRPVKRGSAARYTSGSVCLPFTLSGITPGNSAKSQLPLFICGETIEAEMTGSSRFSARKIKVRCAHGQERAT